MLIVVQLVRTFPTLYKMHRFIAVLTTARQRIHPNPEPCITLCNVLFFYMRWAGHVARMGAGEVHTGLWWGRPDGKIPFGRRGVDGRIILKCIFKKWVGEVWTGLLCLG
jgi:hypothetical protein